MDPSSEKLISDRAKGEKLKFIFETLNKDKKRYDRIQATRILSSDETQEYEEICRKLKSFHEKCSIFIKTRKNGPGKFLVDSYVNWCNSKEIQSNFLSNRIYDELLWSNLGVNKQNQATQEISSNSDNKMQPRVQNHSSMQAKRDNSEINANVHQQKRLPHPFTYPSNSNPNVFVEPRPHPHSNSSMINHHNNIMPQYANTLSPYIHSRSPLPPFHSRSPRALDGKNNSDGYQKLNFEQPGLMNHPSSYKFESKSSFSGNDYPTPGNSQFTPNITPDSRSVNNQFQNKAVNIPKDNFCNDVSMKTNSKPDITQGKGEQYSKTSNLAREGLSNSSAMPRNGQYRPNTYDQRVLNQDMFPHSPMQSSFRNFNLPDCNNESKLTLEDIIPIGAKDLETSPLSQQKINKASNSEGTANISTEKASKLIKNKHEGVPLHNNDFDTLNRSSYSRFTPPYNSHTIYQFEANKNYPKPPCTGISNGSPFPHNFPPQRVMPVGAIPPAYRPGFSDNIPPHKFTLISQNQSIGTKSSGELYKDHPLCSFPNSLNRNPGSNKSIKTVVRATRRTVPNTTLDEHKALNNSSPLPKQQEFSKNTGSLLFDKKLYHKNFDQSMASISNKKSFLKGCPVNLNFASLLKLKAGKKDLPRKMLFPKNESPAVLYAQLDSILHRTLFISCMMASERKDGKLTSNDIETAFEKACVDDFLKNQKYTG